MGTKIEQFYVEVGQRVRRYRNKLGFTQEELGRMLAPPTTRVSIANVESGRQRILAHSLTQFAKALKVEASDLLPSQLEKRSDGETGRNLTKELVKKAGLSTASAKRLVADPTTLKPWKEEEERH